MSRLFLVFLSWPAFFILLTWSLHTVNYERDHGGSGFKTLSDNTNELDSKNFNSIVYIIRHAEKPEDGRHGLSCLGRKRTQCILNLFGPHSRTNISYIIAAPSRGRVKSSRSIDTVKPLAEALHLEIDSYCNSDDAKCVAKRVEKLQKSAAQSSATSFNILYVGRHSKIRKITKALGVQNPPKYPDEYALIWQIQNGQLGVSHQHCPKLDNPDDMDEDEEFPDCDSDEDIYDDAYGYGHAQVSIID